MNPQLKGRNYKSKGKIYLIRCNKCGRENYLPAVASGVCAWCGDDANLYDDVEDICKGE